MTTTEPLLKWVRHDYIAHHPQLQTILSKAIPGQFETTKHGAKVLLTREQASEAFNTVFASKILESIVFHDDYFILPYFTYARLTPAELTLAIAELIAVHNAQHNSPHSPRLFGVVISDDCDQHAPSRAPGMNNK